jgi:2-dehydropantoate 2-reductase
MKIAIVGAGRIGSTFAFHLARASHDVTLIARGARLEELSRAGAITTVGGERAIVMAAAALDPNELWDLVLVTVLAHQVEAVLPSLRASRAKAVMFMCNTFDALDSLDEAVGGSRVVVGFPTMTAFFVDGKLKSSVRGPGKITTTNGAEWAGVFERAGLPSEVEPDMQSFLRSHAALVVPLMALTCFAHARQGGVSWDEAKRYTRAMKEGFAVVRRLGHRVIPPMVARLARMPSPLLTSVLWTASRTAAVREFGTFGPAEGRYLIDAMIAAAPGATDALRAIRP